ncbi:hypothetical protein ACFE04_021890 [Oxalis oulophora]
MTKGGFVPDLETFNFLVEIICKSFGDEEIGFCIEMYHNVRRLGLCIDTNTYKILIPELSKVGRIDEALIMLSNFTEEGHKSFPGFDMKVKGHPPNQSVYTMLITMCGRGGKFVEATNYLGSDSSLLESNRRHNLTVAEDFFSKLMSFLLYVPL